MLVGVKMDVQSLTWCSGSSDCWQHACQVPEDKHHIIQCQVLEVDQVWEESFKKLWEWLKAQHTFKLIIDAIIKGLRGW